MTKFQKVVASGVAAAGLLLNVALPVLATTTIEISGNGADSTNYAGVGVTTSTVVVQSNEAFVSNDVNVSAETGDNKANKNTGGSVSIETGDASVAVGVSNEANSNMADVAGCCGLDGEVLISGNGADSENTVELGLESSTEVFQTNVAILKNKVEADSDTGDNEAKKNTGGDVEIKTGDASVGVAIANTANANSAVIGGSGGGGSLSARILGNGAGSTNYIGLGLSQSLSLTQNNLAKIKNEVNASAETGDNEAKKNTGGSVSIETGDATVTVGIDNMVNFNWADVDCGGCLLEVLAKIAGNGVDSENTIEAVLEDGLEVFQTNLWDCKFHKWDHHKPCNKVEADADTGGNVVKKSTGDPLGDPTIETGDAGVLVDIENTGNANVLGSAPSWWPELPELPELPDFQFGFNWAFFWAWLGLLA